MGNAAITVYSGSEYTVSDKISGDFYGGNFLFTKDLVDGTFGEKADYLNINLLRFPGGAMTEQLFDVNNPDNIPTGESRETLTNFLSFVGDNDITPVIVLPIKKYIHDGIPIEQAAAEISNFVQRVTSGEFGNVKIDTFEIGNEYNIGAAQVTAAEYGAYAAAFALAIKAASAYDVDVAVQVGTHWGQEIIAINDNNQILQEFTNAGALHAVDTIVFHTYPRYFDQVEDRLNAGLPDIVIDDWNTAVGKEVDFFVSEWNMENSWDKSQRYNYGLAQASTLIKMTSEMLKKGVDIGAIWAIQQNTKTELAGAEGDNDIRFAGEIFRMLSESTVGTKVLDIPDNIIGNGQVATYAFESKSKTVVFLSALDIVDNTSPLSVELNLSNILSDFTYVWGEKLSTDGAYYWHNGVPTLSTLYPPLIINGDMSTVSVTFDKDYEIIKLVFLKDVLDDTPVHVVGDDINNNFRTGAGDDRIVSGAGDDIIISGRGSDTIWGGDGRDIVQGREGDDTIDGGSGNDILGGGKGNDILYGQDGDDRIRGGEHDDILYGGLGNDIVGGGKGADILHGDGGDDILKGGPGNDVLYGGLGDDILRGSFGDDVIVGNEGDDILWGGDGQDVFVFSNTSGNDTIRNFEHGLDMINVGNISFDNVIQTMTTPGLELSFGDSSVLVSNYDAYLDEASFILI